MNDFYKKEWDESFLRLENNILFPKEEIVKFINRYVRKKTSADNDYIEILTQRKSGQNIKGLDFGCGNGRQTILLEEFGIEAYGCDISNEAIKIAKKNAEIHNYSNLISRLISVDNSELPYSNNFFNICIIDSCLDSMHFEVAKQCIKEIGRVTENYIYISLICEDKRKFKKNESNESIVQSDHEFGTIQSYFNIDKINELISEIDFKIISLYKNTEHDHINDTANSRFYIILKKKESN